MENNNNDNNKTFLIIILAIAALCCCLAVSCCAAAFYTFTHINVGRVSDTFSSDTQDNPKDDSLFKPVKDADEDEPEVSIEGFTDDEIRVIRITEKTRGLTAEEKLAPVYKSEEELREELMEDLSEVTDEELADELGLYSILAFAPEDFDLRQFYVDLYTEQIAGYYDPEDNNMYLIEGASDYDNALTLAHEYTHFLQYNNPDFDETLNYEEDFCEENGETCVIIDALVEGDASLTENLIDVDSILKAPEQTGNESEAGSDIFDRSPKFFQDSLLFPYVYGFDFVAHYYLKGGYDAVNDLFINLPQSVEQIIHPEKYNVDLPVDVSLEPFKTIIEKDCDIVQENVLNESDIRYILGSSYKKEWQLSEKQTDAGADGWGGGSFIFARKEGKPLFFAKVVWDNVSEAKESEDAFRLYSDKRFGKQTGKDTWQDADGSSVYLIRQDDILYWMILPDNFGTESFIDLIQNGSAL